MRFGLVIDSLSPAEPLADLVRQAVAAESAGFDLVWLPQGAGALSAPVVCAAALAAHTTGVRVAVQAEAGVNPVYLAEEAAVADLCLGGRLVFAVGATAPDLLGETVDVLLAATAARPFRHAGPRFRIPAGLPENEVNRAERVRVTPAPAALELPIWLTGPHAAEVAIARCLTFVGATTDSPEQLEGAWRRAAARLGPAVNRLRRVAVRDVSIDPAGTLDDDALVHRLRHDQRGWGMDVALIRLPAEATFDARVRAIGELAAQVMPRLQLDILPPGLETYWKQRQEDSR